MKLIEDKFVVGEPIPISIVIHNPTGREAVTNLDVPSLKFEKLTNHLEFKLEKTTLKLRSEFQGAAFFVIYSIPRVAIPPNGTLRVTIFLQRYLDQPQPGKYRVPYSFDHWFTLVDAKQKSVDINLKTNGVLVFSVDPEDKKKLGATFEKYTKAYIDKRTSDEQKITLAEALSVIDSPVVIPYLARIISETTTFAPQRQSIHRSLARFSKDGKATAFVLAAIENNNPDMTASDALTILGWWGFSLPNSTLQELKKRGDDEFQKKLQKYIEIIKEDRKTID